MKDKFYIIIEVKKTINYINKIIVNYPKVEYVLKNNIELNSYKLLEYCYKANILKENRLSYQKEIIVIIRMIDYYFYLSYLNKLINKNKYESISNYLLNIMKYVYGWIRSEEGK